MASQKKRLGDTRREREAKIYRTFGPLHTLALQLKADAVDSIKGEPVLLAWGELMSAAHTLEGFGSCFQRIAPNEDLSIMQKLSRKLNNGVPIALAEVEALIACLQKCEAIYRQTPLAVLKDAILTEQICIELDAMKQAA